MARGRGWMADDDGSVLIAVVGIMVVLTVLVIGAFGMASDNLFQTKRERARAQALSVAEAGLEQIMWRIKVNKAPTPGSVVVVDVPGMGSASVECSQTGSTSWHLIATGETTAVPGITRTISTDILSMSIWDMFFAKGVEPGTDGHINGNGNFYGKAYMVGDWPPSNGSANFEEGPFFVKSGNFALGGNAQMGMLDPDPNKKVDLYCDGNVDYNNARINVFTSVPSLPMPRQSAPELAVMRNTAMAESSDGLQGSPSEGYLTNDEMRPSGISTGPPVPLRPPFVDSMTAYGKPATHYYKVVDDDSVVNTSVAEFYIGKGADDNVLPSFGRPYDPDLGHSQDDFSWDATRGVLTVQGTVFIDAKKVYIKDVSFAGKGVIVTPGDVYVRGRWEPYPFTQNPAAYDTEAELKAAFSDPNGYPKKYLVGVSSSGVVYEESPRGFGLFYAGKEWTMEYGNNGLYFNGTVVSPEITFVQLSKVHCTSGMGENVPPSMPGGGGQIVAIAGWHEGRK